MNGANSLGWCAAALTLLTFPTRDMHLLRMGALAAKLCFIAYATAAQLWHLVLVPVNVLRLRELGCPGAAQTCNRVNDQKQDRS